MRRCIVHIIVERISVHRRRLLRHILIHEHGTRTDALGLEDLSILHTPADTEAGIHYVDARRDD
jgi:hypothetical protein